MSDEKILLVDDEKDFIETLSERMEIRGMRVVTASSGNEAVGIVGRENIDCVILDMMMPGMDGTETLKAMLKADKGLQVIMLTGHATVAGATESLKLGAMDFMEKPADIDKLVEAIKEAKIKRMIIIEKKSEAMIKNIMKRKGW